MIFIVSLYYRRRLDRTKTFAVLADALECARVWQLTGGEGFRIRTEVPL